MAPSSEAVATAGKEFRYERKFLAHGLERAHVERLILVHPALFREVYPPRYVNNVYFDTGAFSDVSAHLGGMQDRSKTRVRWYGDAEAEKAPATLEFKIKSGYVGTKDSYRLGELSLGSRGSPARVARTLRELEAPEATWRRLDYVSPVLFNRYRRAYFVSANRRFRITVDTELAFRRIERCAFPDKGTVRDRDRTILELKYDRGDEADAERVSARLPFRLDRVSKYLHGIHMITGRIV